MALHHLQCPLLQAYASVLRPLCEAESPPAPALSAAVCDRAVEAMLALVEDGLDLSLPWLLAGTAAGADVLHLALRRMQQDSGPVSSAGEPDLDPRDGESVQSCASSRSSAWSAVSMPMKTMAASRLPAAGPAAIAVAAALAAARTTAADCLVEQEGVLSDLMQLARLASSKAALAALNCLAKLACSPIAADAIVEHDSTGAVLASCLTSKPVEVKAACLRAAEALSQHSLQIKQGLAAEEGFMHALAEACQDFPQAQELRAQVGFIISLIEGVARMLSQR